MSGTLFVVAGLVGGVALGGLAATPYVVRLHRRTARLFRLACPDPEAYELTEADREAVASDFLAHATAVRSQLSEYADAVAGEDEELRELLRHIESGARS